ncbi:MAG: AbrB/MazE/SpoVT family DNA-binding domain-containing protein [Candidatus Daviesbacteria bacterium]
MGKYSEVISIPKEILKKLGWRKGQKVEVTSERKKIEIKDF